MRSKKTKAGILILFSQSLLVSAAEKPLHSLTRFSEHKPFEFHSSGVLQNDVVIAIIDNGVDVTHKNLKNQLWINDVEQNGISGKDDDGNGYVDDVHGYNFVSRIGNPNHETALDHGTHVAGLAVVDRHVKLMALNVFGGQLSTDIAQIDEAIRYAADHGADVINISISGPGESVSTANAIQYALHKGCIVMVAAGNSHLNIDGDFQFPASYAPQFPGLISVGAVDLNSNELCDFPSSGSNYGVSAVKIAAPGCDREAPGFGIYSTRSKDRFGYKKGTSMAAPLVSGAAALVLGFLRDQRLTANTLHETTTSLHPKRPSPELIERIIMESSVISASLLGKIQGGKRLDLTSLVKTAKLYLSEFVR